MVTKSKVYFWAPGSQRSVDPEYVAGRIDSLATEKGVCHPQDLVDDARPANSPLHVLFEWDDEVAGELFRRDQARQIIRLIRPVMADSDKAAGVPAFVHVRLNGQDGYMRTDQARSREDVWAEVLDDALKQLKGLEQRYRHLSELAAVWQAVREVEKKRTPGRRTKVKA